MSALAVRIGLISLCFASVLLAAAEVPDLLIEDKRYEPTTGTVEFTLVNQHSAPAVAWSLNVLSTKSDGSKANFSILEDRAAFFDRERWVSNALPERGHVPAGGRLRQSLKVEPDSGGLSAVTIRVKAVVYEDVAAVGDPTVIDRIFASRVARVLATREALEELFKANLTGAGLEAALSALRHRARAESSPTEPFESSVAFSLGGAREYSYLSLFRISQASDIPSALANLEAWWKDQAVLLLEGLRAEDRDWIEARASGIKKEKFQ